MSDPPRPVSPRPDPAAVPDDLAYLDHAASTPVRPAAVAEVVRWLEGNWANPSGAHRMARSARTALDDVRDVVAEVVGAPAGGVVFTSGGTEADNLAVLGALGPGRAVCSAVEHHAVLDAVGRRGGTTVAVDAAGRIDLDALASELQAAGDVALVSVMAANNETGVRQDVAAVVEVVREHAPAALVHTDAVQAACWLDLATATAGADLVSLSAHKFGGPKGVGALVVRGEAALDPRSVGGGQERGRRSGTQNLPGIAAMGMALAEAAEQHEAASERVAGLLERLCRGVRDAVDGVHTTLEGVPAAQRLPNICHLCIEGIETEALIVAAEQRGVMLSAAASCASGAAEPSHVLAAMGLPPSLAAGSVRLSLGWCSTDDDVDRALEALPDAVDQLRRARSGR